MWKIIFFVLLVCFEVRGDNFRLPNDTRPVDYHIVLEFGEIGSATEFKGDVFIKILILENTTSITVHSAVDIIGTPLLCRTMSTICLDSLLVTTFYFPDREFLFISTPNLLQGETFYLNFQYTARIFSAVNGVYRGSYSAENNVIK